MRVGRQRHVCQPAALQAAAICVHIHTQARRTLFFVFFHLTFSVFFLKGSFEPPVNQTSQLFLNIFPAPVYCLRFLLFFCLFLLLPVPIVVVVDVRVHKKGKKCGGKEGGDDRGWAGGIGGGGGEKRVHSILRSGREFVAPLPESVLLLSRMHYPAVPGMVTTHHWRGTWQGGCRSTRL